MAGEKIFDAGGPTVEVSPGAQVETERLKQSLSDISAQINYLGRMMDTIRVATGDAHSRKTGDFCTRLESGSNIDSELFEAFVHDIRACLPETGRNVRERLSCAAISRKDRLPWRHSERSSPRSSDISLRASVKLPYVKKRATLAVIRGSQGRQNISSTAKSSIESPNPTRLVPRNFGEALSHASVPFVTKALALDGREGLSFLPDAVSSLREKYSDLNDGRDFGGAIFACPFCLSTIPIEITSSEREMQ